MNALEVMTGGQGTRVMNDTNSQPLRSSHIALSSDAVITSLKVNDEATDVKSKYVTTPGSAVGMVLVLKVISNLNHNHFSEITLSAGSAVEIKGV